MSEKSNQWLAVMQKYQRGEKLNEASEVLAKVCQAVKQHGSYGEVTIRLKVQQMKDAQDGMVTTEVSVNSKLPKAKVEKRIFYVGESGELGTEDPRQKDLEFGPKVVKGGASEEPEAKKAVNQ